MTIRVKRPDGEWDEIPGGHVDHHERGGALHVQTPHEPTFYEPDAWEAYEVLVDEPVPIGVDEDERVFPEGFV